MQLPEASFFQNLESRQFPFGLGSDNHSGVHPRILETLKSVNIGFAPSYGTDIVTEEAIRIFRGHFGRDVDVHFCFNGTAANVLALAPMVQSYNSIICSEMAHINVDECAAAEKLLGTKLIPIATADGKITPEMIEPLLIRRGDQHYAQAKVVSITQPTEVGTLYTRDEIAKLVAFCKKHDLWLHMDGARFINSATGLGCSLKEVVEGVDALSFGGTKNGLMFGEAVLFLSDRARAAAKNFPFIRKQLMQLPSKTRFIAAQFIELLGTGLWQEISRTSLARARELREGLEKIRMSSPRASENIRITQKTESNVVFAIFDRETEKTLRKSIFFYIWDEKLRECRLMTSWSTTQGDVERILDIVRTESARA